MAGAHRLGGSNGTLCLGQQDACCDLARAGFTPVGWLLDCCVPALSPDQCPGEEGPYFSRGVVAQVLLCRKGRDSPGCLGTVFPGPVGFFLQDPAVLSVCSIWASVGTLCPHPWGLGGVRSSWGVAAMKC